MSKIGLGMVLGTAVVCLSLVSGCGEGTPYDTTVQAIFFETQTMPAGGAGQLYNQQIRFNTEGGAALPDRFELQSGVLPTGITLTRDREDNDLDGLPDEDGAFTGHARLFGFPREQGTYNFTIQAISTGAMGGLAQDTDQPDVAVYADFSITVGEGSITIMTPTAEEGTKDPAVPAFPDVIDFVNPANPQAFFSFGFLTAGGSGSNLLNVYLPRELELSAFDKDENDLLYPGYLDVDESGKSGDKFENAFDDGGWFVLQAGEEKVQVGGFQSPRGVVGFLTSHGDPGTPLTGLDPEWFQKQPGDNAYFIVDGDLYLVGEEPPNEDADGKLYPPRFTKGDAVNLTRLADFVNQGPDTDCTEQHIEAAAGSQGISIDGVGPLLDPAPTACNFGRVRADEDGPAQNSHRTLSQDSEGDSTLGTVRAIRFSDYFDPKFEGTHASYQAQPGSGMQRRKYPFTADEYTNAFFLPYEEGVDLTPLRFRAIVEAIDTRGTTDKSDHVIYRKSFNVQVKIPDIVVDTVVLPDGQAGVDYNAFCNASGGVPPLEFDLEWVDGSTEAPSPMATDLDPLTKTLFGLELDPETGQFFGVPRASSEDEGTLDLTVRVSAAVMSPTQGGSSYAPTGGAGEWDGEHPITKKKGRHKTIPVYFALPTTPTVANASLAAGIDGTAYPGDRLTGSGGVAQLIPYPVGFTNTPYPSSQVARTYDWDASYIRDSSHGAANPPPPQVPTSGMGSTAAGLPFELTLVGDRMSAVNGEISGTPYDRGFHPVTIKGEDVYVGDAGSPSAPVTGLPRQPFTKDMALSVSPDTAIYARGAPTASGGTPTGLLDATNAMNEVRMVPMFLQAAIYSAKSGEQPALFGGTSISRKMDLLPVMLCNGGTDAHVEKNVPSISGFWPAEAGKLNEWVYYYYGYSNTSWKHMQQELCWIQTPGADHRRVILWADTRIDKWSSASSGAASKRYQQYDNNGQRGVLVVEPHTGKLWVPAILSNSTSTSNAHGSQFGAEFVLATGAYSPTYSYYGYSYSGYHRNYNYAYYGVIGDREFRLQGLGSYLESFERSSNGRQSQGRGATSVAMSADGIWCATAMPGGTTDVPKLLIFRTDKQPISWAGASSVITRLNGIDTDGTTVLTDSAVIVDLRSLAYGYSYSNGRQRYVLPDSLMFVRDGLVFLMERRLDYVFGLSLTDGHLSSRYVNSRTEVSSGQRTGYYANSLDGQYIPDQDYLRGQKGCIDFSVQFSFKGNDPNGEEGPDKIAFVVGDNYALYNFADYGSSSYVNLPGQPREGFAMAGNRNKSLLFLETSTSPGGGLDVGSSTLKDLTGYYSYIYGDLLTPGRPGEELDFLDVSDNGEFVAVVRDHYASGGYAYLYYSYIPTFHTSTYSSTSTNYRTTDDVMICSTTGKDLDSQGGTQTVLYYGSGNYSTSYTGTPTANNASYCSARSYFNAKGRRINGLRFAPDNRTLIVTYAGDNSYWTKYYGGTYQYAINSSTRQSTTYRGWSAQISVRIHFLQANGTSPYNFGSQSGTFMKNNLQGLSGTGITGIGDTSAPFTVTRNNANTQFWATFQSHNRKFLYYVIDQISGRNYLVGFNISGADTPEHDAWVPFSPHSATVGFEQFDVNSWNYESRFATVPAGVVYPPSGRDGAGIVFIIGSDASAGATSATDLEVYAFDADIGGDLAVLTSDVTGGSTNAINHLYPSADGNFLAGQICKNSTTSSGSRAVLNGRSDLFAVTNVHAALPIGTTPGAAPNAVVISAQMSHGASVAFVGEKTVTGPQAIIFSSAPQGDNKTWDDRTLKLTTLSEGTVPEVVDGTQSHYAVLAGTRKLDDIPTTAE